jgi:pimeloyl-ACP methyl ester carboxylesterase
MRDVLGESRFFVVGHHWGGPTALALAAQHRHGRFIHRTERRPALAGLARPRRRVVVQATACLGVADRLRLPPHGRQCLDAPLAVVPHRVGRFIEEGEQFLVAPAWKSALKQAIVPWK